LNSQGNECNVTWHKWDERIKNLKSNKPPQRTTENEIEEFPQRNKPN